jgi:hypothetical protein
MSRERSVVLSVPILPRRHDSSSRIATRASVMRESSASPSSEVVFQGLFVATREGDKLPLLFFIVSWFSLLQ